MKEYIQLQVTNTQGLPCRRKVLILTWKDWVKAASVQCCRETSSHIVLFDGTIVDVMVNQKTLLSSTVKSLRCVLYKLQMLYSYHLERRGIRQYSQAQNSESVSWWTQEGLQKNPNSDGSLMWIFWKYQWKSMPLRKWIWNSWQPFWGYCYLEVQKNPENGLKMVSLKFLCISLSSWIVAPKPHASEVTGEF